MRRIALALLVLLSACGTPQEQNLAGLADWAESRLASPTFVQDASRGKDPAKPSDAVAWFFGSAHLAGAPKPPEDVGLQPHYPASPWVVVLRADDEKGEVVIDLYKDDVKTPASTRRLAWPP